VRRAQGRMPDRLGGPRFALMRAPSRHQPRLCPHCQGPIGRQEDACWRCGARLRHVDCSGRHPSAANLRPMRRRRARQRPVTLDVRKTRPADARPSRAEDQARRHAERIDAKRRQEQRLRELVAAIDVGEDAYRRLCDRLDDFDVRLASVRRRLSTKALSAVMDAEPDRGVLLVTHRREEVALAGRERALGAGPTQAGRGT
jgi:hypothetical protein